MTTAEDFHRVRLAVDNTHYRQVPLPVPWFERWYWFAALCTTALGVSYLVALVALSFE